MKLLGLDSGDAWVGTALSDPLGILARPLETVEAGHLSEFLKKILSTERITTIIIGNPITLKGTESLQTKKIHEIKEKLSQEFSTIHFILWDERLSSKRAEGIKAAKTKEEKRQSHSRAAAFILQSYLDYKDFLKSD